MDHHHGAQSDGIERLLSLQSSLSGSLFTSPVNDFSPQKKESNKGNEEIDWVCDVCKSAIFREKEEAKKHEQLCLQKRQLEIEYAVYKMDLQEKCLAELSSPSPSEVSSSKREKDSTIKSSLPTAAQEENTISDISGSEWNDSSNCQGKSFPLFSYLDRLDKVQNMRDSREQRSDACCLRNRHNQFPTRVWSGIREESKMSEGSSNDEGQLISMEGILCEKRHAMEKARQKLGKAIQQFLSEAKSEPNSSNQIDEATVSRAFSLASDICDSHVRTIKNIHNFEVRTKEIPRDTALASEICGSEEESFQRVQLVSSPIKRGRSNLLSSQRSSIKFDYQEKSSKKKWVCDHCKGANFESYIQCYIHEKMCKNDVASASNIVRKESSIPKPRLVKNVCANKKEKRRGSDPSTFEEVDDFAMKKVHHNEKKVDPDGFYPLPKPQRLVASRE